MSSNFLNTSGSFMGVDMHLYLALVPPDPAPVPVPFDPHVVAQSHLVGDASKKVPPVTTMSLPVLQKGWKMMLVPHVPFPEGIPHAAEWVNLAAIIILSSSQPELAAHTVHAEGEPLLVQEFEAIGVNVDCSDNWIGFGADINLNTVKTTPTLSDYLTAAFHLAAQSLGNQIKGRNSGYSVFPKHAKGTPRIETVSDAVKQQVKKSSHDVVKKEVTDFAKDKLTDFLKDQVPDGFMQDAVEEAVSMVGG